MYRILIVALVFVLFCAAMILADEQEMHHNERSIAQIPGAAEAETEENKWETKETSSNLNGKMARNCVNCEESNLPHNTLYQLRGGRAARLMRSVFLGQNGQPQQLHTGTSHDWHQKNWGTGVNYAQDVGFWQNGGHAEQTGSD